MNRNEHLFKIVEEECSEVAQRVSKILRFGINEVEPGQVKNNEERLLDEWADLRGMMKMLEDEGLIKVPDQAEAMERKRVKVEHFLAYSKAQGTLSDVSTTSLSSECKKDSIAKSETWERVLNMLGGFVVDCFCDEGGSTCRDCTAALKLKTKIIDARERISQ